MTERFDARIINARERPLSKDINAAQARQRETLNFLLRYFLSRRTSGADIAPNIISGFFRDSFRVKQASPTSMDVVITAGFGFMDDGASVPSSISSIVGLDDLERYKSLYLSANQTVTLAAAPGGGQERYDLIEVKYARDVTDSESRDVLDTGTGEFVSTLVNKTLSWDMLGQFATVTAANPSTTPIGIKTGVVAGVGTAAIPSGTSGYTPIAIVYVGPAVATLANSVIRDSRRIASFDGVLPFGITTGVTGTVGAPGAPDSFSIIGAEGLQVAGVGQNNGTAAFVDIWILTPNLLTSADVSVSGATDTSFAFGEAVDPVATIHTTQISLAFGQLTSAQQAVLNGANALPTLTCAVGQPYVRISAAPISQSAGVTTLLTGANSRTMRLTGMLRIL